FNFLLTRSGAYIGINFLSLMYVAVGSMSLTIPRTSSPYNSTSSSSVMNNALRTLLLLFVITKAFLEHIAVQGILDVLQVSTIDKLTINVQDRGGLEACINDISFSQRILGHVNLCVVLLLVVQVLLGNVAVAAVGLGVNGNHSSPYCVCQRSLMPSAPDLTNTELTSSPSGRWITEALGS